MKDRRKKCNVNSGEKVDTQSIREVKWQEETKKRGRDNESIGRIMLEDEV